MRTKVKNLTILLILTFLSSEAWSRPMLGHRKLSEGDQKLPRLREILSSQELSLLKQVNGMRRVIRKSIREDRGSLAKRPRKKREDMRENLQTFISMNSNERMQLLGEAVKILEEISTLETSERQVEMMKKSSSLLRKIPMPPRKRGSV